MFSTKLTTTIGIAREAGALLRQDFAGQRVVDFKSAAELVTDMDHASERLIVERLRQHFPDHLILAEERGADTGLLESGRCWIIDPLDGTNNYAHKYPVFCVSLALAEAGIPVLGVVYDPLRDECFAAQQGHGAFCNDRPLHVSHTSSLSTALLSTGFPYRRFSSADTNVTEAAHIIMQVQDIRRSGSAALDLCYVAAGRTDGHWELGLNPWDCGAGALLITEAGGKLSNWAGSAWNVWQDRLVATNGLIHQALLEALHESSRP